MSKPRPNRLVPPSHAFRKMARLYVLLRAVRGK
jgi:hypothetical protein